MYKVFIFILLIICVDNHAMKIQEITLYTFNEILINKVIPDYLMKNVSAHSSFEQYANPLSREASDFRKKYLNEFNNTLQDCVALKLTNTVFINTLPEKYIFDELNKLDIKYDIDCLLWDFMTDQNSIIQWCNALSQLKLYVSYSSVVEFWSYYATKQKLNAQNGAPAILQHNDTELFMHSLLNALCNLESPGSCNCFIGDIPILKNILYAPLLEKKAEYLVKLIECIANGILSGQKEIRFISNERFDKIRLRNIIIQKSEKTGQKRDPALMQYASAYVEYVITKNS